MHIKISAKTDIGQVRDHNEDNFIICPDVKPTGAHKWKFDTGQEIAPSGATILVVADGMGGANAGEVASEICVSSIKEFFDQNVIPKEQEPLRELMVQAMIFANQNILDHMAKHPETQGMGTTMILALRVNRQMYIGWVGDSRAYLFREGILQPLSKDHSQVQEWVNEGELSYEEAFDHSMSHIITQHLGAENIDPSFVTTVLHPGDKFMLCSDGLNGMLRDGEIEELFKQTLDPTDLVSDLVEKANEKGGRDNITVVLLEVLILWSERITQIEDRGNLRSRKKKPLWVKGIPMALLTILVIVIAYFIVQPALNTVQKPVEVPEEAGDFPETLKLPGDTINKKYDLPKTSTNRDKNTKDDPTIDIPKNDKDSEISQENDNRGTIGEEIDTPDEVNAGPVEEALINGKTADSVAPTSQVQEASFWRQANGVWEAFLNGKIIVSQKQPIALKNGNWLFWESKFPRSIDQFKFQITEPLRDSLKLTAKLERIYGSDIEELQNIYRFLGENNLWPKRN